MIRFVDAIVNFFLGCWHTDTSRAFTVNGETYIVCLDCGKKLPYSLETMAVVRPPWFPGRERGIGQLQPASEYASVRVNSARVA